MKLVVTILQARRVVLPYFFCRYALPRMQAVFPGEIEVVLVQHRSLPQNPDVFLETSATDPERGRRVVQWTEAGKFEPATVVTHDHHVPNYPSIPTFHLACKTALERNADFHLWIEDDALVVDESCGHWPEVFGRREMGVYRHFSDVNAAFFVTRPSFDERALPGLADFGPWRKEYRVERFFHAQLRTRRVFLNPAAAVRSHRVEYPYTGTRFVAERVRELAPDEAHLLDLELGAGASQLPPVTPIEMRWLQARDWVRPSEFLRRGYTRSVEAWRELTQAR